MEVDHPLNTEDGQLSPSEPEESENNKIDDLYWESDIIDPNQVITNLGEFEDTIPPIPVKKVISRNVSNSQRRSFR
jgi:hypothetical protein